MENEGLVIQDGDGSLINESMHSEPEDNCTVDIKEEWKRHLELSDEFSWWFEGVGLTSVAGYGVFLNWLAISILKTPKLSCFFNHLLCCLAVFDINFENSIKYISCAALNKIIASRYSLDKHCLISPRNAA